MKRLISVLLVLILVISTMPMAVFAAETATISLTSTFSDEMTIGDVFTVTASITNNPTFLTTTLSLKWNEDVVKFTGFNKNARGSLVSDVLIYGTVVANDANGVVACADTIGYDADGTLYTANFEIIGSGDLELGLKDTDATEFEMIGSENAAVPVTFDYSAIKNLSVAAPEAEGPAIPDGAPFTAITTDVGAVSAIEYMEELTINVWGSEKAPAPYYLVTIPADATEVYVTHPSETGIFANSDSSQGTVAVYGYYANTSDLSSANSYNFDFEEVDGGYVVVFPTVGETDSDWDGIADTQISFVADEDGNVENVATAEDTNFEPICFFGFKFAAEGGEETPETYSITIDESMVGGTLTATDENGDPITEAAAGDIVYVTITPAAGYTGTSYTINGELANDLLFQMPAENVVLSATFTPIHTCSYTESVVDAKYLKTEATCQSGAVYYKSCECGEFAETAGTFISGDPVDCVYVNGACKWCGEAEPVQTPGYSFATSADVTAENGGTAVVHVKITGHSNPNITTYNAYDLTLTYDNTKLEFVSGEGADQGDQIKIEKKGDNTIQIVGVGDAKGFDVEVATLTFKTKAEGAANVTVTKVQVSDKKTAVDDNVPEATPKHDEDDTGADETPDVSVIVVPYSVDKPGFISGNDNVVHGADYTFSYTDTTNYTYSDLTVTVGGVPVTPTEANGVYTIANVTGAIVITATQTPNSYDVTKPENVTGPDKATYGEDYIFTVTPSEEDMAIDTVKVTLADGTEIPYTINENGEYVIAGADIAGAFEITVTEKEKMTTVTFSGIEETEIEGGLTQTAEIGKDFTFKLIKEEGYDYTVKVGETELTESEETAGQYTIPAELVVKGGVAVTIEKVDNTTPVVDVVEYISLDGKAMFLVTAKWGDKVLSYGEDTMFWSDKYTVTDEEKAGAYCWLVLSTDEMNTIDLVKAAAEVAIVEAAEGATATAIRYDYDVNGTTKVDVNDAQLAYDMYNASYMEFNDTLPMLKFLEADMETDGKLDTKDVAAIISYIVNGANA